MANGSKNEVFSYTKSEWKMKDVNNLALSQKGNFM